MTLTLNHSLTLRILACLASALALLATTGAQAQTSAAGGRQDELITEMNHAFKRGDKPRLRALLPRLRGHALEPWGVYWEMKARMDEASPADMHDTLRSLAGTYQEDRLRNDWLQLLGARRDWNLFASEYAQYRMRDDREVECYALHIERLVRGQPIADDVRRNWYGLRDAEDGCTHAAAALYEARQLSALDVWRKARLAIENNRPRAASSAVTIVSPESATAIGEINGSPARWLAARASAHSSASKELQTLALIKMATQDPVAAAAALEGKGADALTPEGRSWVWGVIGKQANLKLLPEASEYFIKARNEHLNDDLLAWKLRTALRATDAQMGWPVVLAAANAMSEDGRKDPMVVYWKARALKQMQHGKPERVAITPPAGGTPTLSLRAELQEAQTLLEAIASGRGFYEMLALEELGRKIAVPIAPAPLTATEKEAARLNAGLNRALHAIALGLRQEGVREWNYTTNLHTRGGMAERELLAAADLACAREVWDRCINTSERTREGFDAAQRFPMPFRDAVIQRSREIRLDPAYVYGLIRQESRFIMDARSHVGASGLMQVMPATARWTARKIGLDGFRAEHINDRDTNIQIGTAYLKLALDDFGGSMPLAAAAYNAGPSRSRAWRNGPILEAAAWAENVPFSETRDYVKKVLANTTMYAAILTGQAQSLRSRLGLIGPRSEAEPTVNKDLP